MKNLTRTLFAALSLVTAVGVTSLPVFAATTNNTTNNTTDAATAQATKRVGVDAKFDRYLLSARGHVIGIHLEDGAMVFIPRGAKVETTLKQGDAIHVDAKMRATTNGTIYTRPVVTKGGVVVIDGKQPPLKPTDKDDEKLAKMTDTATVSSFLFDARGRASGMVMSDGTIAWVAHKADLVELGVKKGDKLTLDGKGGTYALGKAMVARSITLPSGTVLWPGKKDVPSKG